MFPFKIALNTSTIFPFALDVIQQVQIASQAGYEGIELWMKDIEQFLSTGGTIEQLRSALEEADITFVNAIAFFEWADENPEVRAKAFKQAEEEMRLLKALGCQSIAAPPFGQVESVSLDEMAERFHKLVELGRKIGVEPILEFWGMARKLSTLQEALYVLNTSGVENGKMLVDPFHMYVGGSDFAGLNDVKGQQIGVFHVNDYPDTPPIGEIGDQHRVFPGEGMAPLADVAQMLHKNGYEGYLSLELFIEDFGERDALEIAKYGLQRVKTAFSL